MRSAQFHIIMSYHEFTQLLSSFSSELSMWPPSQQDFSTTLTKAKMNAGLHNIRLSESDRQELRDLFSEARKVEHLNKGRGEE